MDENVEVLYFDESSVNLWDHSEKVWMDPEKPFSMTLSKQRGAGVTLIAAISNRRPDIMWEFAPSTNKVSVLAFFKKYLARLRKGRKYSKIVIVLDNHASHRSLDVRALIEKNNCILHFLPSW
jgi:hypothetical protein